MAIWTQSSFVQNADTLVSPYETRVSLVTSFGGEVSVQVRQGKLQATVPER
jgi:hypothetical protein